MAMKKIMVGTVLRLYDESQKTMVESYQTTGSCTSETPCGSRDMVEKIKNLHVHMQSKQYTQVAPTLGRTFTDDVDSDFGEDGGELKGKHFTLRIPKHKEWRENRHRVRVREQDPEDYLKRFKHGTLPRLDESMVIPIFDVDINANSPDTNIGFMDLFFPVGVKKEAGTEYVVLQQDKASPHCHWSDITDKCMTAKDNFEQSVVISIPIEKSSRIWVVRVKRTLRSLAHVFLALLLGEVLFRVLLFCKIHNDEVVLRVIGISEELYQNKKGVRTEVHIAKEADFRVVEESDAKQLIRKGKLVVSFYLAGNCQKSVDFGIGSSKIQNVALREDFRFSVHDLQCIPKIEIKTGNDTEEVLWSIDLENLINIEKPVKISTDLKRPEFNSIDEEVKDEDIPWLAHAVNTYWEKLAVRINITAADINIIKDNHAKHGVEQMCTGMLQLWRTNQISRGVQPTWSVLQGALEDPVVGRADIIRSLYVVDEICDRVLLQVSHKVAAWWRQLGCCLNVPLSEIDTIEKNHTNVEDQCMALLRLWRRQKSRCLSELINALCDPVMQQHEVANELTSSTSV